MESRTKVCGRPGYPSLCDRAQQLAICQLGRWGRGVGQALQSDPHRQGQWPDRFAWSETGHPQDARRGHAMDGVSQPLSLSALCF